MTPEIILASRSKARQNMLQNAGLVFDTIPADLDEKAFIDTALTQNQSIESIAEKLASAKAIKVSRENLTHIVIGSDQILEFEGKLITKSKNLEEAAKKLKNMAGKSHKLHSSVCIAQNGKAVFSSTSSAILTMNSVDTAFLDKYIANNQEALLHCVGGYKIEEQGAWLFKEVKGDVFTIMGMPLLPLLSFLREKYGIKP